MSDTTISQLAKSVGVSDKVLLEKLKEAGITKSSGTDMITTEEKNRLLRHIQSGGGSAPGGSGKRMSLKRSSSTQQVRGSGQSNKVNVEVRKKRTVRKPAAEATEQPDSQPAASRPSTSQAAEEIELPSNIPASAKARGDSTARQEESQEDTASRDQDTRESAAATASASGKPAEAAETTETAPEQDGQAADEVSHSARQHEEDSAGEATVADTGAAEPAATTPQSPSEQASDTAAEADKAPESPGAQKAAEEKKAGEGQGRRRHGPKGKSDTEQRQEAERRNESKKSKKAKGKKKQNAKEYTMVADDDDSQQNQGALSEIERKRGDRNIDLKKVAVQEFKKPATPVSRVVEVPESITVAELAQRMAIKSGQLIKSMMKLGIMATANQTIDQDTAVLVLEELKYEYKLIKEDAIEEELAVDYSGARTVQRAPVVTIMGHVDHGKTSLLDYIRKARVTSGEAGGITQHIGAYAVHTEHGDITFLDTPGHEAFTAMRSRGATCTDLVVLVVAADDGVMPQTVEAIEHAKAAGVPLVIAVNKMDKPQADPDRVKNELTQYGIVPEEWGGETIFTPVSALQGTGVDEMMENVLLQSEVLELEAVAEGPAKGVVIEAKLQKGKGPVATVLVQAGQLNKGDVLIAGQEFGRVRSLMNDRGQQVKQAGPSTPVEIIGLSGVPASGDEVLMVQDEKKAKEVAEFRQNKAREEKLARQQSARLSNLFEQMNQSQEYQTLSIIVRADVQGSLEAICDALNKLSGEQVKVNIISQGVGAITASDITLATASEAIVFGFNVRAPAQVRKQAEQEGVELRYYSVIYNLIDEVRQAMEGLLSPELKEKIVGIADVRDVFRSSRIGAIAGCMVTEGVVKRNNPIRVLRNQVVVYEGRLESLRRFKDDVMEVKKGMECGIGVKNYNDVHPGDQIEVYETYEVKREIQ